MGLSSGDSERSTEDLLDVMEVGTRRTMASGLAARTLARLAYD